MSSAPEGCPRGLPLTTGEGNTARERAENTLSKTPGPRASDAQTLARDVLALLAERDRLREQLDAARQALDEAHTATHGQAVDDALAYVEMRQDVLGTYDPLMVLAATVDEVRNIARAALGVEGPAE